MLAKHHKTRQRQTFATVDTANRNVRTQIICLWLGNIHHTIGAVSSALEFLGHDTDQEALA